MKTTFAFAAVAAFVAVCAPAHADSMVFSSWGGTTQ
ncbi:ABC transporter substrate-binding protein, partial [Pseudomonas sp. BGM005]|nr:ABC transporter substrate-binding protein [Pseudomonas sp. BG5]